MTKKSVSDTQTHQMKNCLSQTEQCTMTRSLNELWKIDFFWENGEKF